MPPAIPCRLPKRLFAGPEKPISQFAPLSLQPRVPFLAIDLHTIQEIGPKKGQGLLQFGRLARFREFEKSDKIGVGDVCAGDDLRLGYLDEFGAWLPKCLCPMQQLP